MPMAASPYPSATADTIHIRYEFRALNYSTVKDNNTRRMELIGAVQDGIIEGIANHTLPPPQALMLMQKAPACPCPEKVSLLQQQPYCPCMPGPAPGPFPGPSPGPAEPASTNDYTRKDVAVFLSAGSIVADATITPHMGTTAEQLFAVMDQATLDKMRGDIMKRITSLADLG